MALCAKCNKPIGNLRGMYQEQSQAMSVTCQVSGMGIPFPTTLQLTIWWHVHLHHYVVCRNATLWQTLPLYQNISGINAEKGNTWQQENQPVYRKPILGALKHQYCTLWTNNPIGFNLSTVQLSTLAKIQQPTLYPGLLWQLGTWSLAKFGVSGWDGFSPAALQSPQSPQPLQFCCPWDHSSPVGENVDNSLYCRLLYLPAYE